MGLSIEHPIAETTALLLPRRSGQNSIEGSSSASHTKRPSDTIKTVIQEEETENRSERIEADIQFINQVASLFSTRISYHYIKELDQIAVKIIERDTEKVVKQIPPENLINMRIKLRNNFRGLILDNMA